MRAIRSMSVVLMATALASAAWAEPLAKVNGFPSQVLRFISPFPAGGASISRLKASRVLASLKACGADARRPSCQEERQVVPDPIG